MIPKELQNIIDKFNGEGSRLITGSYDLACKTLKGLQRGNGHPFMEHVTGVADIVVNEIGLMPDAVAALFIHEATRKHHEMLEDLRRDYSEEILTMADGLNKISEISPKQTRLKAEIYRKLIVSYSKDPRVTLIKLADRLEVMRNLNLFPPKKIKGKAAETIMLYVPIAHQLGLYNIKSEMEDLCFKYQEPEHYRAITNKLIATEGEREKLAEEFIKPLEETLGKKYKYKLKIRTKTAYSIFQKMKRENVGFEGIYDVFAIRFIVEAPQEKEKEYCWDIFSEVTKEYKPIPERLRDWITTPKPNGYESLHTTVQNKDGARIEVQIRTVRMDEMAENGNASHWSYKGIKSVEGLDSWLGGVKELLESPSDSKYSSFANDDIKEIFVYTKDGDLKQLPKGSTILDFAFDIHSNLGARCSGAKVNGKVVSIREELHTGDIVEIMSTKNQKPSRDWLNFVVTSKARSRIKARIKEEEGKLSSMGRELFERRMKNWKIPVNDDLLADLTHHFKTKTIGDFYIGIYEDNISMTDIKGYLTEKEESKAPQEAADTGNPEEKAQPSYRQNDDFLIISDNVNNVSYSMAKCCNPIFGDDVFGFVSAKGGVKIHRISCPNAKRLLEKYPYRIQRVKWRKISSTTQFRATLKIIIEGGELSTGDEVVNVVNGSKASLRSYSISERGIKGKGNYNISLCIFVGNNKHLDSIISEIKKIKGVKTVLRISGQQPSSEKTEKKKKGGKRGKTPATRRHDIND
ncbi:MAG: HD domain-containing protein [Bacteroidales bacterium]|jgi:GTP pyrophosphokinase|nr:HD domain-containing protein [Bacteroidales bacterium]